MLAPARTAEPGRLNDTRAIQLNGKDGDVNYEIGIRTISNGWLVRKSYYNSRTGDSSCTEMFYDQKPVITQAEIEMSSVKDDAEALARAMGYVSGSV